jgi:hypothetical protein
VESETPELEVLVTMVVALALQKAMEAVVALT